MCADPNRVVSIDPHSEKQWFGRESNPHLLGFSQALDLRAAEPSNTSNTTRNRASSGTRTRTPGFGRPGPYLWNMLATPEAHPRGEHHEVEPLTGVAPVISFVPRRRHPPTTRAAHDQLRRVELNHRRHRLTGGRSSTELRRNEWRRPRWAREPKLPTSERSEEPRVRVQREPSQSRSPPCEHAPRARCVRRYRTVKDQGTWREGTRAF